MSETFDLVGIGMTSQRTRNRLVERLREKGVTSEAVLAAIGSVPRHIFIDEALAHRAYEDTALPIGQGQTISQPFVVALMTQALLNRPRQRVLEVGTGSGYQTAVLASLDIQKVFTIERLAGLQDRARARLAAMGCRNVRFRHGDGYRGWAEEGPFDGILVTAAPPLVPQALIEQLAPGGRLVVPVGGDQVQELTVYDLTDDGVETTTVERVRFLPLVKGVG
ncbi:MAG: protein-L-isoaspartate(D-aspartate) O-methyltransferase [Gammaproteobacteria bacterium]|jgi:protein-L-isoaspartate(D-aspartate) O-methyltransferase